ncbi:MAG: hypothetical protein ACXVA9_04635 [Bdellovibrionales bacterium]
MAHLPSRKTFLLAFLLWLSSWAVVQAGIVYGHSRVAEGAGIEESKAITSLDLFRFDSLYYRSIAEAGYSYNGDPNSSPNLVFAPMFPLLVRAFAAVTPFDLVVAGFVLNKILFFFALLFLFSFFSEVLGTRPAFWILFAMVTAAGAYSFHAYYSESTMLFFLGLCLWSYQRRWWPVLALSSAALGASRVTAAPISAVFAILFFKQAWCDRKSPKQASLKFVYGLVCMGGAALYLGFVDLAFGNPFELFPQIQSASWGKFHPPTEVMELLTLGYLRNYWSRAVDAGMLEDIKMLNLFWTSLAVVSVIYMLVNFRKNFITFVFGVYFLFIYCTNSSSDYLISAHRFFTLMIPIFMMFGGLHAWIASKISPSLALAVSGWLLVINIYLGIFHTAQFNQGTWYFF